MDTDITGSIEYEAWKPTLKGGKFSQKGITATARNTGESGSDNIHPAPFSYPKLFKYR